MGSIQAQCYDTRYSYDGTSVAPSLPITSSTGVSQVNATIMLIQSVIPTSAMIATGVAIYPWYSSTPQTAFLNITAGLYSATASNGSRTTIYQQLASTGFTTVTDFSSYKQQTQLVPLILPFESQSTLALNASSIYFVIHWYTWQTTGIIRSGPFTECSPEGQFADSYLAFNVSYNLLPATIDSSTAIGYGTGLPGHLVSIVGNQVQCPMSSSSSSSSSSSTGGNGAASINAQSKLAALAMFVALCFAW